jgi:hypothetical protein
MRLRRTLAGTAIAVCLARTAGAEPLADARDAFREADFEMALGILASCLSDPRTSGRARADALVLQAQCHARLDEEDAAVRSLCEVLEVDPRWEPDPTLFSPHEMRIYRITLAVCPPPEVQEADAAPALPAPREATGPRWWQRKFVWVGAGAAALAAALLLGGDDGGGAPGEVVVPRFPDPPTAPSAGGGP